MEQRAETLSNENVVLYINSGILNDKDDIIFYIITDSDAW